MIILIKFIKVVKVFMKEQNLIVKKIDAFELKDIFDCGQCFRWNEEQDGSYTGVIKNGVLNVKCDSKNIF